MAKKSFESALARLEQITAELEAGDLSLDKSLATFNEGITLAQFCNDKLQEAKVRVDLLLNKNGQVQTRAFIEDSEDDGGN